MPSAVLPCRVSADKEHKSASTISTCIAGRLELAAARLHFSSLSHLLPMQSTHVLRLQTISSRFGTSASCRRATTRAWLRGQPPCGVLASSGT